ncbi:protein of unknown function DUF1501 [Pirellula staleyi DSM 6068]|uniref:DUF1501 domain-containing protein n=1 Tax=Pirellula staleyi (strain ATCC 27377 / DSM 6068 / ICPB 4128) TaxID=530564 RepID=D2QZR6_PIRSD|nr:DUF1501 domain-containing protein [Pirellula staleyi]ADB16549.1 protein of unknown function DUF1501 [Pirellula staleyi DSM 6068]
MCTPHDVACGSSDHLSRRSLLKVAGLGGLTWLTPLAERLALAHAAGDPKAPAQSVIVLWMQGGPSQFETFDPHPGTKIGGSTKAIKTAAKGIEIADGLEQLADQMQHVSLVRSIVSKEGDHERATYTVKTGWRPDPTVVHPSLGAVVCHQLSDKVEIPRHISILPNTFSARGGYLGDQFDAFRCPDPINTIPDVIPRVENDRYLARMSDLQSVVEGKFARGRLKDLDQKRTLHATAIEGARKMMTSEQLKAFNVKDAPQALQEEFGDTPFGRSCLAALQLVEVGVRCIEITLDGWDTHANNYNFCMNNKKILDPAFASLLKHLGERKLLDKTLVLCGGEFGRTPQINPAEGRDHWPHGFSLAIAGGGIAGGRVIGETAPEPKLDEKDRLKDVARPVEVEDIHATVLSALGIDYAQELETPIGRPMALSKGKVIQELIA